MYSLYLYFRFSQLLCFLLNIFVYEIVAFLQQMNLMVSFISVFTHVYFYCLHYVVHIARSLVEVPSQTFVLRRQILTKASHLPEFRIDHVPFGLKILVLGGNLVNDRNGVLLVDSREELG